MHSDKVENCVHSEKGVNFIVTRILYLFFAQNVRGPEQ